MIFNKYPGSTFGTRTAIGHQFCVMTNQHCQYIQYVGSIMAEHDTKVSI